MNNYKAKKFIKLGTAIRYLNDVKYKMGASGTPEPLWNDHVIDNIRIVLDLTKELKLSGTLDAGAFGKLSKMHSMLKEASKSSPDLTMPQAEELHELARRIRESLLAEGNNRVVYYLDETEVATVTSPGWPKELTLGLVGKMPLSIVAWLLSLTFAAFGLGVIASEAGWYGLVKEAISPQAQNGAERSGDASSDGG